jgi:hypothetical protein
MTENNRIRGRFHPNIELPTIPQGKELHKFHGQPVLLTAKEDGEPMFGKSPYTLRQAKELEELAYLTKDLDPSSSAAEAIRIAFSERQVSALNKTAVDGVLLVPGVTVEINQPVQV